MNTYSRSWSAITVLVITALMLILLISGVARAAGPWYVAPGGSDGDSCLSDGSPCATINGAIGKAASGDTIYVATGTYTSSAGSEVVLIDKSITLSGGWEAVFTVQSGMSTVDGQIARRGITVNSGATTVIERFIIQNGSAVDGGGINNSGTLTLNNSTVSGNTASDPSPYAGGIMNFGTLTLNDSTISGNTSLYGGGIENQGTVTLNNSIVSGHTNQYGGGIENFGTVTLNSSIVSDNTSVGGGGFINGGILTLNNSTIRNNTTTSSAGGISNCETVILNNSTVSGNTSQHGGGILNECPNATLTLNNSTVSGNTGQYGGGIKNDSGTVTLKNSILAGNTATGTGPDCYGVVGSSGYNLIGSTSDCAFAATTGDLLNINPQLFALIGWPGYYPLLPWSPAINAGNPGGCTDNLGNPLTTDQRGIARVGRCDIGAFEYDPNNDPLRYLFLPVTTR